MNDLRNLCLQFYSLTIFRNLLKTPAAVKLEKLIENIDNPLMAVKYYTEFVSELYQNYDNFSDFIYNFILEDENFYIKAKAKGGAPPDVIEAALENELSVLRELSLLRPGDIKKFIKYDGYLPDWNNTEYDFVQAYREHVKNISKRGLGIFSKHRMFILEGEKIVPVKYPDRQSLSGLVLYERERNIVVKNTLALLDGRNASNILLYGDAGTGKSSTVKAIANHYSDMGLRLIEIKKPQLPALPAILGQLAENPLRFIVFIDDLSFSESDDNFTALKALLEGSVSAKSENVVIYATSNRRHLVREGHQDRYGDDVHVNDTLEELIGLTARFGITVTFERPDRAMYLEIVRRLAEEYGLPVTEKLLSDAEAFAIRKNGRSPRTAKQFIELQKSELYLF